MTLTPWLKYDHEIKKNDNLFCANLCQQHR
jgi:hypothetical protein